MSGDLQRQLARNYLESLRRYVGGVDRRNNAQHRAEYHLDELFFALLRDSAPALMVEAGAKDGATAIRMRTTSLAGLAVACEANPDNYRYFAERLEHAAAGVDYRLVAVAAAPGEVSFEIPVDIGDRDSGLAGTSSLLTRQLGMDGAPETRDFRSVTVPATTLDALAEELAPSGTTAAWIDVEGAAGEVIRGGADFLARCQVLKVEVETIRYWADQWLDVDVTSALLAAGMVPITRDLGDQQYNLLFVAESVLGRPEAQAALAEHDRVLLRPELPGALGRARRDPRVRALARRVLRRP